MSAAPQPAESNKCLGKNRLISPYLLAEPQIGNNGFIEKKCGIMRSRSNGETRRRSDAHLPIFIQDAFLMCDEVLGFK